MDYFSSIDFKIYKIFGPNQNMLQNACQIIDAVDNDLIPKKKVILLSYADSIRKLLLVYLLVHLK
jgi:hypothetical protein